MVTESESQQGKNGAYASMTTEKAVGTVLQVIKYFKLHYGLQDEIQTLEEAFGLSGTNDLPEEKKQELKLEHAICKLGALIFAENPYVRQAATRLLELEGANGGNPNDIRNKLQAMLRHVPTDLVLEDGEVEAQRDDQPATWTFRGRAYPTARALRIPYCFTDEFNSMIVEHIGIVYEGVGGY